MTTPRCPSSETGSGQLIGDLVISTLVETACAQQP